MSRSSRSILDNVILPQSALYQGRFGRMFRNLPAWTPEPGQTEAQVIAALKKFADDDMSEPDCSNNLQNDDLPAGYTYFGQFVDHDITFDPTSSLQRQNDPNKLNNFRTPRLDLDCVYGTGPGDNPFMYDNERKGMFLIGTVKRDIEDNEIEDSNEPDLPRNTQGRALIGDPRNDENALVSQFQLAMLRLHNRIYGFLAADGETNPENIEKIDELNGEAFANAQRIVRWFYQFVVWNDFVKRVINDGIWRDLLKQVDGVYTLNNRFFDWKNDPFMPIEFSVAAYRFGHSLIRPGYRVNVNRDVGLGPREEDEVPIFGQNEGDHDLRGFRFFPHRHTVQWDWFFKMNSCDRPFPQPAHIIDPQLSSSVFKVPEGPGGTNHLAFLNLLRSWRMGLPTGRSVARKMGLKPHAINDPHEDILWFYILQESTKLGQKKGKMLGKVGSTIVGEVFAGLLYGDPRSYIRMDPNWTPASEPALAAIFEAERNRVARLMTPEVDGEWQVADLLRASGAPINGKDVKQTIANGHN